VYPHFILPFGLSHTALRIYLESKSLHEGQEDGLGAFNLRRSCTHIDMYSLEILRKGARNIFLVRCIMLNAQRVSVEGLWRFREHVRALLPNGEL